MAKSLLLDCHISLAPIKTCFAQLVAKFRVCGVVRSQLERSSVTIDDRRTRPRVAIDLAVDAVADA